LLEELEAYALTGNKGADLGFLKNFSERWRGVGHIPKENVNDFSTRYNAALDRLYGGINTNRQEKNISQYKSRVENLKTQGGGNVMRREKSLLQDKIDRLNLQIKQYENNMGIFTGKGAEALRKEIEKKIKSCQLEISEIKDKMKLLTEENN
jgi:flagellar biosynthesis chaperone FliJ